MSTYDCRLGRRCVRLPIEAVWVENPRWMGVFTVRATWDAWAWCPWPLYRDVFGQMVRLGILLESIDVEAGYPRYMLARLIFQVPPSTSSSPPFGRGPALNKGDAEGGLGDAEEGVHPVPDRTGGAP